MVVDFGCHLGAVARLLAESGVSALIGAVQNVTLSLADPTYEIPFFVVLIFVLPLVFTLFFGRTFCALSVRCSVLQELVAVWAVKIPRWVDEVLGLAAYAYLGLAIVITSASGLFLVCQYDPFVGLFRLGTSWSMWLYTLGFIVTRNIHSPTVLPLLMSAGRDIPNPGSVFPMAPADPARAVHCLPACAKKSVPTMPFAEPIGRRSITAEMGNNFATWVGARR